MAKRYKYSKMWQVLKEAKKYLVTELQEDWWLRSRGNHKYLCLAVSQTCQHGKCSKTMCGKVTDYISEQLEGHSTLEKWLLNKSSVSSASISHDKNLNNSRKIQTTRHLWLDHMVKTLKEKNL